MNDIYPHDITPEETAVGLTLHTAKAPYGTLTGADTEITIVIKLLSGNRRFIKCGKDNYGIQKLTNPSAPDQLHSWVPIEDPIYTLNDVRSGK